LIQSLASRYGRPVASCLPSLARLSGEGESAEFELVFLRPFARTYVRSLAAFYFAYLIGSDAYRDHAPRLSDCGSATDHAAAVDSIYPSQHRVRVAGGRRVLLYAFHDPISAGSTDLGS
jgi:hypothetical protein